MAGTNSRFRCHSFVNDPTNVVSRIHYASAATARNVGSLVFPTVIKKLVPAEDEGSEKGTNYDADDDVP
jgi:hypothetical protein